jgi:uncharacterized cupin superfamily protein
MSDERKPAGLVRAALIREKEKWFSQSLNPRSKYRGTSLSRLSGLERCGVHRVILPAGSESFAYHAHFYEEEWLYLLSGKVIAEIDGREEELAPGDFLAFPTPSVPHNLKNPFDEDAVYLMGGENLGKDVIDYPRLGKRYLLMPEGRKTGFFELVGPQFPFRRLEEP